MTRLKFVFIIFLGVSQISFCQITHNLTRTFGIEYKISTGYAYLNSKLQNSRVTGGYGLNGAINGEWAFHSKWIFQIGGELSYFNSSISPFDFTEQRNLKDTEGDPFTMNYTYNQFSQKQHLGYINFPLLMGYKNEKYYALAGLKYGIPLVSRYSTRIEKFTSVGNYPQFIDDFENMPNHYYISEMKNFVNPFFAENNFSLSARFGLQFDGTSYRKPLLMKTYRVGIFADYGLKNIQKQIGATVPLVIYGLNPVNIIPNNYIYTNQATSNKFSSIVVGIEFSLLIQYSKEYNCCR